MASLMALTVREVQEIAREIHGDPLAAVAEGTQDRLTVMAMTEWITARRSNPMLKRDEFFDLTVEELVDRFGEEEGVDDDTPEANPTEPAPSP